jgi:hypothetical protein
MLGKAFSPAREGQLSTKRWAIPHYFSSSVATTTMRSPRLRKTRLSDWDWSHQGATPVPAWLQKFATMLKPSCRPAPTAHAQEITSTKPLRSPDFRLQKLLNGNDWSSIALCQRTQLVGLNNFEAGITKVAGLIRLTKLTTETVGSPLTILLPKLSKYKQASIKPVLNLTL